MATPKHGRGWSFLIFVVLVIAGYSYFSRRASLPEAFAKAQSLDQAEARAKDTGMPVLVLATADWCPTCQAMKRGALSDKAVQRWVTENTIPVVMDLSDRNNPPPEAERLRVRSIPALVFLRDGKEMARLEGSASKSKLSAWLAEFSGAIPDWQYANPGKELPDTHTGNRRLKESRDDIKVNPAPPGRS
ncbi:hypothetical protein PHYC_00424 [Phycisphaerales bacterium]|nr:hypothetical protein PHYC_00424 [Phycisphaerales bacterium]